MLSFSTAVEARLPASAPTATPQPHPGFDPSSPSPASDLFVAVRKAVLLLLVTFAAIAINGYHPYGEDAANHVAAIKLAGNPQIFGSSGFFVAPYVRLSLFANLTAQLAAWADKLLHLPLPYTLFAMHVGATWLLLDACFELAKRCFRQPEEQWAATMLVAACLAIPLAGSSFYVMDPYLTSRSLSTPLALLAVVAALDRRWMRTALCLLLVTLFHPLMSIYTLAPIVVIAAIQRRSRAAIGSLFAAAVTAGWIIQFMQRSVVESAAYQFAVMTRHYVFLEFWTWYELVGLFAPLALLFAYSRWQRGSQPGQGVVLAESCTVVGVTAGAVCFLFCRPGSHSHLIAASLQPMRQLQLIYISMFLLIGGLLGRFWLKQVAWRWFLLFGGVATLLGTVQHTIYPASAQVELPWVTSPNSWNKAFLWIRDNTPTDSVFALDADYIHARDEDSQGFRALAERSAIADRSKDGGAAAVFPALADRWMIEQTATTGLYRIDDAERLRRLTPFHVNWVVLYASTPTHFDCPFRDDIVQVCHLR